MASVISWESSQQDLAQYEATPPSRAAQ